MAYWVFFRPSLFKLILNWRGTVCQKNGVPVTIKLAFESSIEPHFLNDSYGYRLNKSALDAITITRTRCWKYNWVIEFDIKGLFDNIDHTLLMKAVRKHTNNKWIILYIERWLKAPMQMPDGIINRHCGTPQGGVISPILSNLFLHYVFDIWMTKRHPGTPWCRYADDAIIHCKSEEQAQKLLNELEQRLTECKLTLHPDKTKIIYCKDDTRKENYPYTSFKFLGYEFRRRKAKNKINNQIFMSFLPAISKDAKKSITAKIRKLNVRNRNDLSLEEIAKWLNPILSGWINYYGKYGKTELRVVLKQINSTLIRWSRSKYLKLSRNFTKAAKLMKITAAKRKYLFVHWKMGVTEAFI